MIQFENEFHASVAYLDDNDKTFVDDANINEDMELEHNSDDEVDDILKCLVESVAHVNTPHHITCSRVEGTKV